MTGTTSRRVSESSPPGERPMGFGWLALLGVPIACCAGPLIVASLLTAGAAVLGGIAAGVLVAAAGVVLIVRSRRQRPCPGPSGGGRATRRQP